MKIITTNLLNRFWKNGIKPIKEELANKLSASKVVESPNITEEGFVMGGRTASEQLAELNGKFTIKQEPFKGTTSGSSNVLLSMEFNRIYICAIPYTENVMLIPFKYFGGINYLKVLSAAGAAMPNTSISGTAWYIDAD